MPKVNSSKPGGYSVREVSKKLVVSQQVVLSLIHSGQLTAINLATDTTKRPRWRIMAEDFDSFISRRTHRAAPKRKVVKKRRLPIVKQYFK